MILRMAEAVLAGIVSLIVAGATSIAGFLIQRDRLRQELRTQFMAEQALLDLLEHPKWKLRSFDAISTRLGGFDDDSLRQLLVRAGAVRFKGKEGEELWGLRHRNLEQV